MSQVDDITFACEVLRKAASDTEKMAALLVVGKLFANRQLTNSDKGKLLRLIGCDFLLKLLNNYYDQLVGGEEGGQEYRFSVDIVVQFMGNIVADYEQCELFFDVLGKILKVLNDAKGDATGAESIVDCFRVINSSAEQLSEQQIRQLIRCYHEPILESYLSPELSCSSVLQLEELMVNFSKQLTDERHFDEFCLVFCVLFSQSATLSKFKLCRLVRLILEDRKFAVESLATLRWPQAVCTGLFVMFKNKLTTEYRDDGLQLATQMTLCFGGTEWIRGARWEVDNSKFLVLLLRLVAIEVQLLLPRLLADRESAASCQMGFLLILLEQLLFAFINNLDCGDEEDEENGNTQKKPEDLLQIDSSTIANTITAIRDTIRKVIEFIKEVSLLKEDNTGETIHQTLLAAIRLLSAYITEEAEELRTEVAEVLPFILRTINNNNSENRCGNVQMSGVRRQVMAAVRLLAEDESMRTIIRQAGVQLEAIDEQ